MTQSVNSPAHHFLVSSTSQVPLHTGHADRLREYGIKIVNYLITGLSDVHFPQQQHIGVDSHPENGRIGVHVGQINLHLLARWERHLTRGDRYLQSNENVVLFLACITLAFSTSLSFLIEAQNHRGNIRNLKLPFTFFLFCFLPFEWHCSSCLKDATIIWWLPYRTPLYPTAYFPEAREYEKNRAQSSGSGFEETTSTESN